MKKLLFIAFMAILTLASCTQNINNINNQFGLKGDVESLKVKFYFAKEKFNEPVINSDCFSFIEYLLDKKGYLTKEIRYNSDGSEINSLLMYKYEDNILTNVDTYNSEGELSKIKRLIEKKDNAYTYIEYKESDKNKIDTIREVHSSKFPILSETIYTKELKSVHTFDDNGCLIESNDFSQNDGELKHNVIFTIKDNLRIKALAKSYSEDATEDQVSDYEYLNFDKKGNWTRQVYKENGSVQIIIDRIIKYRN